ncbi:hypothetical protein [Spirillospora sp. CA-294931]|uniref:hypothetical protein n=1 Tax=Spirillospora sp. CA-294931 TaxID=3240042 RepID=UPI003D93C14A
MADPGAAMLRYARGGFLAAVCTLLALAGHSLGGGGGCCVPPLPALVTVGGLVGVLSVVIARRAASFWQILIVVGWAQLFFHLAFTLSATGPAHHAAAAAPPPVAPGPSMIVGHAVAALAAAVVLSRAERALWWLLGAVFAVALPRVSASRPVAALPPRWTVLAADDRAPRLGVLLTRALGRRGPPMVPARAF